MKNVFCRVKRVLVISGALSLMLAFNAASTLAASPEAADLLFENGVIYTVDAGDTIAEALAVGDGRIVFVGSRKEGERYKGPETKVVDLKGRLMLPGFFDTHIHSPGTARASSSILR